MYILINKKNKKLQLINNESVVFDFPCIIGKIKGRKLKKLDLKTPEGEYKIIVKNPKSKYFLSLGLNYPNIQDVEESLKNNIINKKIYNKIIIAHKTNNIIPWDTEMGGEIYIHGNLDNNKNYTRGCIKISDENMKKLYDAVGVGVRVVIK